MSLITQPRANKASVIGLEVLLVQYELEVKTILSTTLNFQNVATESGS